MENIEHGVSGPEALHLDVLVLVLEQVSITLHDPRTDTDHHTALGQRR